MRDDGPPATSARPEPRTEDVTVATRARRTRRRRIAWTAAAVAALAAGAFVTARVSRGPRTPERIWVQIGMFGGSKTKFFTPVVRTTPSGGLEDAGVPGWEPCDVADAPSVVFLVGHSPETWLHSRLVDLHLASAHTQRTLAALPVPPATEFGADWTEFRCETDEIPDDARPEPSWCGRWRWALPGASAPGRRWPSRHPEPPDVTWTLALAPDGTARATCDGAASTDAEVRRWGVVDGVLYLERFPGANGDWGTTIAVRDADGSLRFAANGTARRVAE